MKSCCLLCCSFKCWSLLLLCLNKVKRSHTLKHCESQMCAVTTFVHKMSLFRLKPFRSSNAFATILQRKHWSDTRLHSPVINCTQTTEIDRTFVLCLTHAHPVVYSEHVLKHVILVEPFMVFEFQNHKTSKSSPRLSMVSHTGRSLLEDTVHTNCIYLLLLLTAVHEDHLFSQ